MGFIRHGPDVSHSAKSGQPAMTNVQYPIPVSVPKPATTDTAANGAGGAASNDVSASVVSDSSKLDQGPDARQNAATGNTGNTATPAMQQHKTLPRRTPRPDQPRRRNKESARTG